MIKVALAPPPPNYEVDVKLPGLAFLKITPRPSKKDWDQHNYWSKIHDYLYNQHSGICAYCALWSPRRPYAQKSSSVDHFKPKKHYPKLAYDWTNYRLSRVRLNTRKLDFQDIIDPCIIDSDWFHLDFATFLIRPSPRVTDVTIRTRIDSTIARLQLNLDNDYVTERISIIAQYCLDKLSFNILSSKYPFIAFQMSIQNFDQQYKEKLKLHFKKYHPII